MCGITGFFDCSGVIDAQRAAPLVSAMVDALRHRGPDAQGVETGDWFGLGHARLSILDLSEGANQPMWCPQRRYVLIYNGEIYNFHALRRELEARSVVFRTSSDTEVVLQALITWGPECLVRFEGMFAGAFIDTQTGTALLFRDHLGIKPLYIAQEGGAFYFASEVKALRPALSSLELNTDALYEHMNFRFVAGDRTLYRNVRKLLPGHFMKLSKAGEHSTHRYYNVTDSLTDYPAQTADMDAIEDLLDTSIREHTLSDVGYSVQLSGGIDSSYITRILSRSDKAIDTYSITLPGAVYDEELYQRQVVEMCGTSHHSYACTSEDFAKALPLVTRALDFPSVHTGTIFLYLLCGHIREKHKVVLTGEGADELFLGYSRYQLPWMNKLAFTLKTAGLKASWLPNLPKVQGLKNLMSRDLGLEAGSFHSDISERLVHAARHLDYREKTIAPFKSLLAQMIASDQSCYLASLLDRQDKISMAHSVEVRVPFCSPKLFDAINPIKHHEKLNPVPKILLKKLLAKHFPTDFVYRQKNGFSLPIAQWLRQPGLLGGYLDYLRDDTFKQRGFYNLPVIEMAIDQHLKGERDYAKELLSLFSLEIWLRQSKGL